VSILVSGGIGGAGELISSEIVNVASSPVTKPMTVNFEADLFGVEPLGTLPITIQVVNETGAPVDGAEVTVYAPLGSVEFARALTAADGRVAFTFTAPDNMANTFITADVWINATKTGYAPVNESLTINVAQHPTSANGTKNTSLTHWKHTFVSLNASRDYSQSAAVSLVDADAALDVYGRLYTGLQKYSLDYEQAEKDVEYPLYNKTTTYHITGFDYFSNADNGKVFQTFDGPVNELRANASGDFWTNYTYAGEELFFPAEPLYDLDWIKTDKTKTLEYSCYSKEGSNAGGDWNNETNYRARNLNYEFVEEFEYTFWMGTYTVWKVNISDDSPDFILWCPELGIEVLEAEYNDFEELKGYKFLTEYNTLSGDYIAPALDIDVTPAATSLNAGENAKFIATVVDEWDVPVEGADITWEFTQNEMNVSGIEPATVQTNVTGVAKLILGTDDTIAFVNQSIANITWTATLGALGDTAYSVVTVLPALPVMNVSIETGLAKVYSEEALKFAVFAKYEGTAIDDAGVKIELTNAVELNITAFTGQGSTLAGTGTIDYTAPEVTEDTQLNFTLTVTKAGYKVYTEDFTLIVLAGERPSDVPVPSDPVVVDLAGGGKVTVYGGIIGEGEFNVAEVAAPTDADTTGTIGIFVNVTFNGSKGGIYKWIYIGITYVTLPDGVDADDLKLYYWSGASWVEATGIIHDKDNKVVSANVTHLTVFAPMDLITDTPDDDIIVDPNDTDNDGMLDTWEIEYFGDLTHDGTADGDGDDFTDHDEYIKGTDPTDGDSYPGSKKDEDTNYMVTVIVIVILLALLVAAIIAFVVLRKKIPEEEEGEGDKDEEEEEEFECPECGALVGDDDEECPECGEEIERENEEDEEDEE